jgi:uncharacterized phiE125 gp8 family phage protein
MADLTTAASVKTLLRIPSADTTHDTVLSALVTAASKAIENFVGRTLGTASYTKQLDGSGEAFLMLPEYPVNTITSVHVDLDRQFNSDSLWVNGTDYLVYADEGILRAISLDSIAGDIVWPRGNLNVKVAWSAGFATIPKDLSVATDIFVAYLFQHAPKSGVSSIALGSHSVTFANKMGIPDDVKDLLQPYFHPNMGADLT